MNTMKGKLFGDVDIMKLNVSQQLLAVLRMEFESCFQQCQSPWNKYTQAEWAYFEGNWAIIKGIFSTVTFTAWNNCKWP